MSLKRWMLGKVNDTTTSRGHARRIAPSLGDEAPAGDDPREPAMGRSRDGTRDAVHLGPYGPLIGAIRDELEHFVASQLRLHLAIAEHDRYVLTSIEVECADDEAQRALLRRFVTEFKPEQIKQYLARDVIAGLRNASAIDLSQFAGLNAQQPPEDDDDDPYQDLIADLQKSAPSGRTRGFEVALLGRWSQTDVPTRSHARSTHPARGTTQGASTPLAGRTFALDVEDTAGTRRVELTAIVPGQRYTVGKDPGCDVTVDARYASRRHCELWFEHGTWWVADAGSTNGIRVDANDEAGGAEHLRREGDALELPAGATLVLSAAVEAEVAELDPGDRTAFLADLGLTESARDRFIRASYALLDLISFLTAGDDECRAWPIRRGTGARKAAGRVHSDIERGFIRAEVTAFDDFVRLGSEAKCREAGKLRLEGKDYVVQDGDIVHFRFAV